SHPSRQDSWSIHRSMHGSAVHGGCSSSACHRCPVLCSETTTSSGSSIRFQRYITSTMGMLKTKTTMADSVFTVYDIDIFPISFSQCLNTFLAKIHPLNRICNSPLYLTTQN